MAERDAVVVGSGPNGLAAAVALARAGRSVLVLEAASTPGGGARTEALTLPGFAHDVCSAVHPMGVTSPFFARLPLVAHGLEWIVPPAAVAHPLDDGTAITLERSIEATAQQLGRDAAAYRALMGPLAARWRDVMREALAPLHLPRNPVAMALLGVRAIWPTTWLNRALFREERARALFAGIAAHATLPLDRAPSAAFGVMLSLPGHATGWPIPRGGSGAITSALVSYLRTMGGEVATGRHVSSLADVPPAHTVLLDVTAHQWLRLAGERLPAEYRAELERFQPGLGTFKVDYALDAPIPWTADACRRSATVHLGGTAQEIVQSHAQCWAGQPPERPYVLLAQPTLFDPSRAPAGAHVVWAYCHVPFGSEEDMTGRIEAQIERFAPGFRSRILARHTMGPRAMEAHNPNLFGGDINGGESTLRQLFFRPVVRANPYATPLRGVYLCSSSTPPGGAVHGMCGYYAARAALGTPPWTFPPP